MEPKRELDLVSDGGCGFGLSMLERTLVLGTSAGSGGDLSAVLGRALPLKLYLEGFVALPAAGIISSACTGVILKADAGWLWV